MDTAMMRADGPSIRLSKASDFPAIYEIARESLPLDGFSRDLLHEKLFANRRPDEFRWAVYVAEQSGQLIGFMQSAARPSAGKGWIGLFAVSPAHRRRAVGRSLHQAAAADTLAGVAEVEAIAIPCNYLTPGLDPRYTEALCFLESLGYTRFADCANLAVELRESFHTSAAIAELAAAGVSIRRANTADADRLDRFFSAHFGEGWRFEAQLALETDPASLHLALRDDRVIGFAAHSTQNRELGFFGPMGTAPECRGLGVGRVLLWLCLNDLREAGHPTAVIPWVGPISFYHRWAGCRVERIYWRLRRILKTDNQ